MKQSGGGPGGSRAAKRRQKAALGNKTGGGNLSASLSFGGGVDESKMTNKKKREGDSGGVDKKKKKKLKQGVSNDVESDEEELEEEESEGDTEVASAAAVTESTAQPPLPLPNAELLQSLSTFKDILDLQEITQIDSYSRAMLLLNSFIGTPTDDFEGILAARTSFYANHWEAKPLVTERHAQRKAHFKGLVTRRMVERVLDQHTNVLGSDLELSDAPTPQPSVDPDVDSGKEPETAKPHEVWRRFGGGEDSSNSAATAANSTSKGGATIRLLQPAKHIDGIWHLLSALECEFGCRVWAHADLALPGAQSFAQSRGLGDSFVLQVHGKSRWRLYAPASGQELPRFAAQEAVTPTGDVDLSSASADLGRLALDVVLQSGDSLYVPRGWAFSSSVPATSTAAATTASSSSGAAPADQHSLFLRVITNSGNDVAALLDLVLPSALAVSADQQPALRRGLPGDWTRSLGVAQADRPEGDAPRRAALLAALQRRLRSVAETALDLVDAAADQLSRKYISERLPPVLSPAEETAQGRAGLGAATTVFPFTRLRMLRPGLACCVVEDGKLCVYHCMDNSRELFGSPLSPLEFDLDDGPAIEALLAAYPHGITVTTLPHPSEEESDKVDVAAALFREGFLVVEDEASKPAADGSDDGDDNDPF